MGVRTSRYVRLFVAVALAAVGLGAVSGCANQGGGGFVQETEAEVKARTHRAQQVGSAWDGSSAAAEWRAGYHPIGAVTLPPRGGPRNKADETAYRAGHFTLRTRLPGGNGNGNGNGNTRNSTGSEDGTGGEDHAGRTDSGGSTDAGRPGYGRVTWRAGGSLTRPVEGAKKSYEALAAHHAKPHLIVTGVRWGEMDVVTSRGVAKVPAWLFSIEGYDTPLRRAAATPSKPPEPPIGPEPGAPRDLGQLVRVSADGRALTVAAMHGACDDGARVAVRESSGSVVLSAYVKKRRRGYCTKQASWQHVTVRLERPVGERVLLDARSGRPVTHGPTSGSIPVAPSPAGSLSVRPSPAWD